jgi:hypothetical protein
MVWCTVCRGEADDDDVMLKCTQCSKYCHPECSGLSAGAEWSCVDCDGAPLSGDEAKAAKQDKASLKRRVAAVRAAHARLRTASRGFLARHQQRLAPFCDSLGKLLAAGGKGGGAKEAAAAAAAAAPAIRALDARPAFVRAELREYQVDGVRWLLEQFASGVGGILGDEVGGVACAGLSHIRIQDP